MKYRIKHNLVSQSVSQGDDTVADSKSCVKSEIAVGIC
mgnify:CR=1 FL=1